jgi:arylformamidase
VKIVDISLPLKTGMAAWPCSPGFEMTWVDRIESGDDCNTSRISCDTHIGTHIDAPLHFVENGQTVDQIPLERLIGPCRVVYLPGLTQIDAQGLDSIELPAGTQRLLLKTDNSNPQLINQKSFQQNFVSLTTGGARWLVEHSISLVGIDYFSIGSYSNGVKTHQVLLEADVVVLEGLNLSKVEAGDYELICLPLRMVGAEGAPVRAVLRKRT